MATYDVIVPTIYEDVDYIIYCRVQYSKEEWGDDWEVEVLKVMSEDEINEIEDPLSSNIIKESFDEGLAIEQAILDRKHRNQGDE